MPEPLVYQIYRLLWSGLDWLYPPLCGGCGTKGLRWCSECTRLTPLVLPPLCPICGESQMNESICRECQENTPAFTALRSWAYFGDRIRKAIHRLKYKGDIALGDVLARPIIHLVRNLEWKIDLIVPVPVGLARMTERGYNQAALLAKPLAMCLGIQYSSSSLYKARETRSQVGLGRKERQENVEGAFSAHPKGVSGKCVLVVDDVVTSGSTIQACATALLKAGAERVYGVSLARANQDRNWELAASKNPFQ